MMHDFVKTHAFGFASTEDFQAVVARHMTPGLDLAGNGTAGWFFTQWVYGTEVPGYRLSYQIKEAGKGEYRVSGELEQSRVSQGFGMRVPLYAEFEKEKNSRIGLIKVIGSTKVPFDVTMKLPAKPKRLMINAQEDILCDLDSKL